MAEAPVRAWSAASSVSHATAPIEYEPTAPLPVLWAWHRSVLHRREYDIRCEKQFSLLNRHLSAYNVFASIHQSNSHDHTKELLREFEAHDTRRRNGRQSNDHEHAQHMSDMREKVHQLPTKMSSKAGTINSLHVRST
ncbi:hypothetical protein B0H19DRAFT_1262707 [Mycena capillaripes]|nr:hypothetical protein B0H19DRAFT_1262707 [Mycena capillaripes]